MFNIIQDDLNTQESYLGRHMEKAIENEENGRWPTDQELAALEANPPENPTAIAAR